MSDPATIPPAHVAVVTAPAATTAGAIDPTAHAAALAEAATLRAQLAAASAERSSAASAEAIATANAERARIEAELGTARGEVAALKSAQLKATILGALGTFKGNPDDFLAMFTPGVELGQDGKLTPDSVVKLTERRTVNAFLFEAPTAGSTPIGSLSGQQTPTITAQQRAILAQHNITPDAYKNRKNFAHFAKLIGHNADAVPAQLRGT